MKLLVFGAGNIGRSLVGQLFARAGWQVTFVEVSDALVDALNRARRYRIEVRDRVCETVWVEGVSAIHGSCREEVARAVAEADLIATAVGLSALPSIYPALAIGLQARRESGRGPVDIIICENLRNAAQAVAHGLREYLPADVDIASLVGLVETSIGKMVPITPRAAREQDPLVLHAEAYNTLILDAQGFRNPIPDVPGLDPKQNMAAHVDRKAFIHNLGHATCAYLGHLTNPSWVYVWQTVEDEVVRRAVKAAMWESGRALLRRYPEEFTEADQEAHIEDLLRRFGNQALGDTIYRVGRDLPRKLSREDRLVGALLMDVAEGVPAPVTALATAAALFFRAEDEHGELFPADAEFRQNLEQAGVEAILRFVCGLSTRRADDARVAAAIRRADRYLQARPADWLAHFLARPEAVIGDFARG